MYCNKDKKISYYLIKMVKKFSKRFKFIDESYNANPLSMTSAINNMDYYNGNKKNRKTLSAEN